MFLFSAALVVRIDSDECCGAGMVVGLARATPTGMAVPTVGFTHQNGKCAMIPNAASDKGGSANQVPVQRGISAPENNATLDGRLRVHRSRTKRR